MKNFFSDFLFVFFHSFIPFLFRHARGREREDEGFEEEGEEEEGEGEEEEGAWVTARE